MNISSLAHLLPTRTKLGLFLLTITFIIIALPLVDDPDFGWHLKSGHQRIFNMIFASII